MLFKNRYVSRNLELVLTGKAFNMLVDDGSIHRLLPHIRIFSRMTPDDKVQCVKLQMTRAITAMCGDGSNDAGALKAAHAGIALNEAESSIVAHFSSSDRSLKSCTSLLAEGRCALDSSFASYKFLIMYGQLLSLGGLAQYYFGVNMSQASYIP